MNRPLWDSSAASSNFTVMAGEPYSVGFFGLIRNALPTR